MAITLECTEGGSVRLSEYCTGPRGAGNHLHLESGNLQTLQ